MLKKSRPRSCKAIKSYAPPGWALLNTPGMLTIFFFKSTPNNVTLKAIGKLKMMNILSGGYRVISRTKYSTLRVVSRLSSTQQQLTNKRPRNNDTKTPKRQSRRKLLFGSSKAKSLKDFLPLPSTDATAIVCVPGNYVNSFTASCRRMNASFNHIIADCIKYNDVCCCTFY